MPDANERVGDLVSDSVHELGLRCAFRYRAAEADGASGMATYTGAAARVVPRDRPAEVEQAMLIEHQYSPGVSFIDVHVERAASRTCRVTAWGGTYAALSECPRFSAGWSGPSDARTMPARAMFSQT